MSVPTDFDWKIYLDLNPDLRKAGLGTQRQAIYHYFNYGKKEKRIYKKNQEIILDKEYLLKDFSDFEFNSISNKKKFLIATIAWKRPEILDIFIKVNKKYCDVLVVKSPEDELLKDYKDFENVFFINQPNRPFGLKLNKRIEWFMEKEEYTHIIFLGSDNIISPEIFESIKEKSKDYDLISWIDIYHFNYLTRNSRYSQGYRNKRKGEPLAPGRCISKHLLKQLGYLWSNDLKSSPDGDTWSNKLKNVKNQIILSCKTQNGVIVDIKSEVNINSYESLVNKNIYFKTSDEEKNKIQNLIF